MNFNENVDIKQKDKKDKNEKKERKDESDEITFSTIASYLLPFAILAGVLSWYKNSDKNIFSRLFYVSVAYVLNIVYILYSLYRFVFPLKKSDKTTYSA